ncbi:hypothetical protein NW768_004908 [Fusarium equiseti]|uniref:Apple domain-containing protein n=1 Tax=Fusarium equiseti TaxID=61235 RepID=A0ABQ8RHL2_FUSEQ|nr:hypothetical protein NW768_004908 [Fusarium equiseti]
MLSFAVHYDHCCIATTETVSFAIPTKETSSASQSESTTATIAEIETTTTEAVETASSTDVAGLESTTFTTEVGTTATDAVTTTEAESTAAAATTSAAPAQPENKCNGLSSPYASSGGARFELLCNQAGYGEYPIGPTLQASSYQESLDFCSERFHCWGVNFHNTKLSCTMWSQVGGFYDNLELSTLKKLAS